MKEGTPKAPKVTREYRVAHGFVESSDQPGVFTRENVRVRDVLRDLGVPLTSFRPTVGQRRSNDVLESRSPLMTVIIESELPRDKNINDGELRNPDTRCTATVWISADPVTDDGTVKKKVVPTKATPRLHIKSAVVPRDRTAPLQVTFEFAVDGTTPLAARQKQFQIQILAADKRIVFLSNPSFSEKAPQIILARPGEPVTLAIATAKNRLGGGSWGDLDSGKYLLRIAINGTKKRDVDYLWTGQSCSDERELIIEPKSAL